MTAIEFMKKVAGECFETEGTVDNFKFGDESKEIKTVVTCLTATPDVLKEAKRLGADLVISHEPTYYEHADDKGDNMLVKLKEKCVTETGIPVCRFHDHMHHSDNDMISKGFLRALNWDCDFDGNMTVTLKAPKTPLEIAKEIQTALDLKHVRIIGKRDGEVTKVGLYLGHRGSWGCWDNFRSGVDGENCVQLAVGGEFCEWHEGEPIRDLAQFGYQATGIILGHAGSERIGMKYLADDINEEYAKDGITAHYVECGELYTYVD